MSNPFAMGPATATPTAPTPPPAPVAQAPAQPFTAPATGSDDPFSAPAPQRPRGPRLREMHGRLLLIMPTKVETVPNKKSQTPGATQERMTADVVVLDGGAITYGGRPEALPPVPHTTTSNVPLKTEAMFISAVGLVSQCRDALAVRQKGGRGMVLGRLTVGEARDADSSPPYLLTPYTDADREIGKAYLAQVDPFA